MSSMLATQLKKRSQQTPAPVSSKESEHRSMPPQGTDHSSSAGSGHALSRIQLHAASLAAPTAKSCSKGYTKPSHCPFGGACHTCPSVVQAKLTVGQPGDEYEQEADRTAERIMRMALPGDDGEPNNPSRTQTPVIQRACPACEDDEEIRRRPLDEGDDEDVLQARPASGGGLAISLALESRINSMKGGGQPLSASVQSFFEPRFGRDLSGIRVHTGAGAAEAARAVSAQAFAIGQDIMFGSGRYAPETSMGRNLLAHELAHTIQQSDARAAASTRNTLLRIDERPEWCDALVQFVEYEDQHGIAATVLRYHPGNSDLLIPLNYDIPSIYGPIDVDWMLRLTYTQVPTIAPSIISPAIAQGLGLITSHINYFGAKLFWNTIRSFSDQYDFELGSILQEANLNAPSVVVHWIHGESLRRIFAPALELCAQHAANQPRQRPAASAAQAPVVARKPADSAAEALRRELPSNHEPLVIRRAALYHGSILDEGSCEHLACNSRFACRDNQQGITCPAGTRNASKTDKYRPLFTCDRKCENNRNCSDSDTWMAIPSSRFALRKCGQDLVVCANGRYTHAQVRDRSEIQAWEVSRGIQDSLGVNPYAKFTGSVYGSESDKEFKTDVRCHGKPSKPKAAASAPADAGTQIATQTSPEDAGLEETE